MFNMFEKIGKVMRENNVNLKGKILYLSYGGSHLHGTNTKSSDLDLKGIFLPTKEELFLQNYPKIISITTGNKNDKNSNEDIDLELFSLPKFLELIGRFDSNIIEILFSMGTEKEIYRDSSIKVLEEERKNLVINQPRAFVGFALKQMSKYAIKGDRLQELEDLIEFLNFQLNQYDKKTTLNDIQDSLKAFIKDKKYISFIEEPKSKNPDDLGIYLSVLGRKFLLTNKIEYVYKGLKHIQSSYGARAEKAKNMQGADFKAISHAIRTIREMIELLTTKNLKLPLTFAKELVEIKTGQRNLQEVMNYFEELIQQLYTLSDNSDLPKKISNKKIEELFLKILKENNYLD